MKTTQITSQHFIDTLQESRDKQNSVSIFRKNQLIAKGGDSGYSFYVDDYNPDIINLTHRGMTAIIPINSFITMERIDDNRFSRTIYTIAKNDMKYVITIYDNHLGQK